MRKYGYQVKATIDNPLDIGRPTTERRTFNTKMGVGREKESDRLFPTGNTGNRTSAPTSKADAKESTGDVNLLLTKTRLERLLPSIPCSILLCGRISHYLARSE
jgi:hypothetical protein